MTQIAVDVPTGRWPGIMAEVAAAAGRRAGKPDTSGRSLSCIAATRLRGAPATLPQGVQNIRSGAPQLTATDVPRATPNGGSAHCYHTIFVPSAALVSPSYDGQPAAYLYIAALEVNVLNCRVAGPAGAACKITPPDLAS